MECSEWFQEQFNHRISQSTVSESLPDRFAYLERDDNVDPAGQSPGARGRNRLRQWAANWPALEAILSDW